MSGIEFSFTFTIFSAVELLLLVLENDKAQSFKESNETGTRKLYC